MAKGRGRESKFKNEFCEEVQKLCLLGAIEDEIAQYFGVAKSTLKEWKKKYPKFSASIKDGKSKADAEVANSLYNRAIGGVRKTKKPVFVNGQIELVEIEEEVLGSEKAMIFWLKNRRPDLWREAVEIKQEGTTSIVVRREYQPIIQEENATD